MLLSINMQIGFLFFKKYNDRRLTECQNLLALPYRGKIIGYTIFCLTTDCDRVFTSCLK